MNQSLFDKKIKTFLDKHYLDTGLKEKCPDDEILQDFAEGNLEEGRKNTIIAHLNKCKKCNEIIKLYAEVTDEGYEAENIPESLSEKVVRNIFASEAEKIKKMVVKLLDRGFEIIESFKGLNYQLQPAPVYRDSAAKEEMLVIDMSENEYHIKGKLLHQAEDKISVELNILKKEYPLSDTLITLYKIKDSEEEVLESQNSSIDGTVTFDSITPGNYAIEIDEKEPVKFQLELKKE